MKALLLVTLMLTSALLVAAPAGAQTPYVGVYFDEGLTRMDRDCPVGGGLDSAYVVARNFNAFMVAIEYAISYPPAAMLWLADSGTPPVTIGNTRDGISEGWGLPQNGFAPWLLAKVKFWWNCNGCSQTNIPVVVTPNPISGFLRATNYPQIEFVYAVGMTSLICATVPAEETTWGKIKSLYTD